MIRDRPELALNELEKYLQVAPTDPRAIYFSALALHQLGRNAQAEEHLIRLQASQPDSPNAALLLAKVRLATGDAAGAESALKPFSVRDDAPLEVLEMTRRAIAQQGRNDEAANLIARAANQYPEVVSAQVAHAQLLQRQGKPAESALILRDVIEHEPDNEQARTMLIRAELMAGDATAAGVAADAFIARAPKSPMALTAKAAILSQRGDPDGAKAAFKEALKIEPGLQRAALGLAALELAEGQVDGARKVLDDLLALKPGDTSTVLARAAIERRESGDTAYIAEIHSGLDAAPDNLELRVTLAELYLTNGEPDKALALLSQTPLEQKDAPSLLMLRARAELAGGQPEQASSTLAQLAESNPRSAQIRYMQASASAALGDTRTMEAHLSEGLRLDPSQVLQPDQLDAMIRQLADATDRDRLIGDLLRTMPDQPGGDRRQRTLRSAATGVRSRHKRPQPVT